MRGFVKSTSLIGMTEISLLLVSVLRNKYLAVTIGPAGLGLFSLLQSLFSFMDVFAGASLAAPALKYISEYKNSKDKVIVSRVFNFSFSLTFVLASFIAIGATIFFDVIKSSFLSPEVLFFHYSLFAASFVATSLTNILASLFQAYVFTKKVVFQRIATNVFGLVATLLLVYLFDLTGFFVSMTLSSIFGLVLYLREGSRIIKFEFSLSQLKDDIIKKVMNFGAITVLLGILNFGSELIRRVLIVNTLNIFSLGLFQAATGLTRYQSLISTSAGFSFMPKISENLSNTERIKLFNQYLRMILTLGTISSVFLIVFGDFIIGLLYAKSFVNLSSVFYIFVVAQFFVLCQSSFQFLMVGMAKMKIHLLLTFLYHLSTVVVPLIFIREYGLLSIGWGVLAGILIDIVIGYEFLRREIGMHFTRDNLILLSLAVGSMALVSFFHTGLIFIARIGMSALITLMMMLTVKRSEWAALRGLISSTIAGKRTPDIRDISDPF